MRSSKTTSILLPRMLIALLLTILMTITFYHVFDGYSQSFKFADEAEHMIMAWLMDKGYSLYKDFPNNHQPISYVASYAVWQVDEMQNVFMMVRRHRQAIFLWSMLWCFLFLWRFGPPSIIPLAIYENIKYYLLGHLFLAESIMVYPLAFLGASLLLKPVKNTKAYDHFIYGLLMAFAQFTLLPIAPALLILFGLWWWRYRGNGWRWFAAGVGSVIIMLLIWIQPVHYVREVINGLHYSLPGLSPISGPTDYLKLVGMPLLFLAHFRDILGWVVLLMLWWWIVTLAVGWKYKRTSLFPLALIGIASWVVTNTRDTVANQFFYRGFHFIPWFGLGLLSSFLIYQKATRYLSRKVFLGAQLITAALIVMILTHPELPWQAKTDPQTDHYIQYSPLFDIAETINALKQPEDRLMVMPNDSWLYMMTNLLPADTNMFTFYDWQVQVPNNRERFFTVLEHTPPTFIVYRDDGSSYSPFMNEYLKSHYTPLTEKGGLTAYIHTSYVGR